MKTFIGKNFMLDNETAKKLYHDYAAQMPIVDYHCHINPKEIYEDKHYKSITEVWLYGDHYKWRAIRAMGIPEETITGNASDREKFFAYAKALEKCIGNPLYTWTHLELKRYFGYDGVLSEATAEEVWNLCNKKLVEEGLSVRKIIEMSNVKLICTTDDPIDSLEWHAKIAADPTCTVKVIPAFRPDKSVNIDKDGFGEYISQLEMICQKKITNLAELKSALSDRIAFFDKMGCRAADHGLDYIPAVFKSEEKVDAVLQKALHGEAVTEAEAEAYKTNMLAFFAAHYKENGWVMQLHYGALRNNNTPLFKKLGPDTGNDAISSRDSSGNLAKLLDSFEKADALPKTIVYSLNPYDNEIITSIIGCFSSGKSRGYMQHGSAWWFNDTKAGMTKQITDLANVMPLGNFVGMLTDSRSFLSYTRHEYFRRILCNIIGQWVENGEYPNDMEALGKIVQDICYNNAVEYFGFEL